MFYYYKKAGKLLASERRDLPYLKAEPAPGTPICYLVEGDPVLGRGSFKVNCPGQLRAPHGLEVLDASRLPDFPLDAPLSAALEGEDELALFEATQALDKLSREELTAVLDRTLIQIGARLPGSQRPRRLLAAAELLRRLRDGADLNANPGQVAGWLCAGMFLRP